MLDNDILKARRRMIEPAKPTTLQRVARQSARAFEALAIIMAVAIVAWALIQ